MSQLKKLTSNTNGIINCSICLVLFLLPLNNSLANVSSGQEDISRRIVAEKITIKLAYPLNYVERGLPIPEDTCSEQELYTVCLEHVYGNEYQLLDWLENAKVHGAYISSVSLHLVRKLSRQKFDEHYYLRKSRKLLDKYCPAITATRNGKFLDDPLSVYYNVLDSLAAGTQHPDFSLNFNSHLDASLFALYQITKAWMIDRQPGGDRAEYLWKSLIEKLSFLGANNAQDKSDHIAFVGTVTLDCKDKGKYSSINQESVSDYLVLRKRALGNTLSTNEQLEKLFGSDIQSNSDENRRDADEWLKDSTNSLGLSVVKEFFEKNYASYIYGAKTKRYFRFKIPELFNILQPPDLANSNDNQESSLALVLTGGGVKSAYQTRMIDYLYNVNKLGRVFLHNRYDLTASSNDKVDNANTRPLEVDHVIGTSGGALLGLFVSTHSSDMTTNYSDVLWKEEVDDRQPETLAKNDQQSGTEQNSGKYISSTKIFPTVDLMRWLSFAVSFIIFAIIITSFSHIPFFIRRYALEPKDSVALVSSDLKLEKDQKNRFFRFTVVWCTFLLFTPWIVDYVNGDAFEEHIPAIQGVFYFVYLLIAVNTDNYIVRIATPRKTKDRIPFISILNFLSGLILTIGPVVYVYSSGSAGQAYELFSHITITIPSLLCVFGLTLIAWSLRFWYMERSPCFQQVKDDAKIVVRSFTVPLWVVVITLLIVLILYQMNITTLLELAPVFWGWHTLVSVIVSIVFIGIGFTTPDTNYLRRKIEPKIRYLVLPHPAKTMLLPLNRVSRMVLLFTVGWCWWNIVVAPGVYGNGNAQDYFEQALERTEMDRAKTFNSRSDNSTAALTFKTFFVAPATSLEKQLERYFLFDPTASTGINLPYEQQLEISSDRRWTRIKQQYFDDFEKYKKFVINIAFSSGSPFPIFPAHKSFIPGTNTEESGNDDNEKPEWLVDGGYAHNIPAEAAKQLGADRVLVLSSSPLELEKLGEEKEAYFDFGLMAQNLPRLLPYFYSRSQIEDVLSAEDMVVATLAPSADPDGWPFLTDFRARTIEKMINEASKDLNKRIGYVQSWGRPTIK